MTAEMESKITVVIADDHPIFRKGLREIIEEESDLLVVGESADGKAALEQMHSLLPKVAVVDIDMPRMNGLAVADEIQKSKSPVRIIFLTMLREEDAVNRALNLGVGGYVLKDSAVIEIVNAIRAVAEGGHYISPSISSLLVNRTNRRSELVGERPGLEQLTRMERRVLELIAEKKTSKEIGSELFISPRTVDSHRNNICAKLDLHGSNALLKFALEHKGEI